MKEITSIEITNPIEIGSSVTAKTFSLDIRLILNQSTVINLEMQVLNKGFWPERSIGYLARSFDNLKHGENYGFTFLLNSQVSQTLEKLCRGFV